MTDDMGQTMLLQASRHGQLKSRIRDGAAGQEMLQALYDILLPPLSPKRVTPNDLQRRHAAAPRLTDLHYNLLLQHVNHLNAAYRRWDNYPHPLNANIFPPTAISLNVLNHDGRTVATSKSHLGNSSIQFRNPNNHNHMLTGFVSHIWEVLLGNVSRVFLLVDIHDDISPALVRQTPYPSLPNMHIRLVSTKTRLHGIIEPAHIVSHIALWKRPAGIFSIPEPFYILNESLNRRRR